MTLALACAVTFGCPSREQAPARASEQVKAREHVTQAPPAELQLAIANCSVVHTPEARRCYFSKPRLLLWLPEPGAAAPELSFAGAPLASETLLATDGLLLAIEIPGPGRLELRRGDARWSAELLEKSPAYYASWELAVEAYEQGGFDAVETALAAAPASADERALFDCFAVQFAYPSARLDELLPRLEHSPAVGCRGLAHLLASYDTLYEHPNFNAARAHIEAAARAGHEDLSAALGSLYYRAGLTLSAGDIDEAITMLERVVALSEAVEDEEQLASAQVTLAVALARLGRFAEAELLAEAIEARLGGREIETVTEVLDNIAWLQLLRREDDARARDPSETLTELAQTYAALERRDDEARTQLHLALAAVQSGDAARSLAALATIDASELTPLGLVWFELVSARAQRMQRAFAPARAHLERAELFAQLHEDPELGWYVVSAEAALARDAGHEARAIAAYERAAGIADALALSVPGSAGRSMVVTSRSRVDAEHVELLLALGRDERAACVAAGTRARHLRSLWARLRPPLATALEAEYQTLLGRYAERRRAIDAELGAAWSLSKAELELLRDRLRAEGQRAAEILAQATEILEREAPRWSCAQLLPATPERALLTMAASPDQSRWWFMLVRADAAVEVVELASELPAEQLAARALESFAPALEQIELLTVVPVGEFVLVDFHASLLARGVSDPLEVRYSLGLGELGPREATRAREASVVAGATNLAAVRRETESVTRQLEARDWEVSPRWSPRASEQPSLLHFAGHGHHEGLGGWDSYIEVPGYGRLSATTLVAQQRAPALVVLGACSAGSADAEVVDGGMNLAAALLLAGAELVIAPSGPVEDLTALTLAEKLYALDAEVDAAQLSRSLSTLQREELAQGAQRAPTAAHSRLRWRVWVP